MTKMRFFLSSLALLVAFSILTISLSTATTAQSATGSFEASKRQLYWGSEVLPDHLAYPVLMAVDRVKLESANPVERVYLQLEYGTRRLEYAQSLIDKKNQQLATTTATKGYKYILTAASESLQPDMPSSVRKYALKVMTYHDQTLSDIKKQLSDSERAVLDDLLHSTDDLKKQLQAS